MANSRGRNARNDETSTVDVDAEETQRVEEDAAERRSLEAENADEARALGDPAPSWATEPDAPEVMTSRDQRRAGVLDTLRRNEGRNSQVPPQGNGSAIVVVGPAGAWLESTLRAELTTDDNSAAHAVEEIIGRVMGGTTAEEIFADDSTVDVKDILGVPLEIWSYKVNESDHQQGMPGYMLITATDRRTMKDVLISCGGYKVQPQLLRAKTLGLLPVHAHFVSNETRAGNNALGLVLDKD